MSDGGPAVKIVDQHELMHEFEADLEKRITGKYQRWPTGIEELDNLLAGGGFQPGQFVVLGGRTSHGKSALGLQLALDWGIMGARVVMTPYEMTPLQGANRWIVQHPENKTITYDQINRPEGLTPDFHDAMFQLGAKIADLPFHNIVGNPPAHTLVERVKGLCDLGKCDILIVDYVQLVQSQGIPPGHLREAMIQLMAHLKNLAVREKIVVVALSQLSRGAAGTEHRPQLNHLQESGALEQVADVALLLWRPAQDGEGLAGSRRVEIGRGDWGRGTKFVTEEYTELGLKKNRFGPTGTIYMSFDPAHQRFFPAHRDSNTTSE